MEDGGKNYKVERKMNRHVEKEGRRGQVEGMEQGKTKKGIVTMNKRMRQRKEEK